MAKPLVKINVNLAQLGFQVIDGTGKNAGKKYVVAPLTDEISFYENLPQIRLVGWELPNKKGTAPLKLDYEEGKKYTGSEQYQPTIGWANVGASSGQSQAQANNTPPLSEDDIPV